MNSPSPVRLNLIWCAFEDFPSGSEASAAAASCAFSLSTLEIASFPDAPNFALTERKQPEIWRWAIVGKGGFILEEGCKPTKDEAKRSAAEALSLVRADSA